MMRTRSARLAAVRGCRALPSLADSADRVVIASEIGSEISSRRVGSILCGLSILVILADLYLDNILIIRNNVIKVMNFGRYPGRSAVPRSRPKCARHMWSVAQTQPA